jgi:hypothetical protein
MLPLLLQENYKARILLMGGVKPMRIDLSQNKPKWEQAGKREWAGDPPVRYYLCPVILPTGEIFFSGGTQKGGSDQIRQENTVLKAEIYSPGIDWKNGKYNHSKEKWQTVEAAAVPRHYHSVALLMPDGVVWTAGSNGPSPVGEGNEKRIELYRPYYIGEVGRPEITASPSKITPSQKFEIKTPQAANIERVAFIRNGSITHAFNSDQRYVTLDFSHLGGDRLEITAPPSCSVAPPGYYMLWIIDKAGRPCKLAKFVRFSF